MITLLKECFTQFAAFAGDGWYMLLFFLCLAILILPSMAGHSVFVKAGSTGTFFVSYSVIVLILFWFPASTYFIGRVGLGMSVYWRMLWLLPVTLVMAYVLTRYVFRWRQKILCAVAILAFTVVLIFGGDSMYRNGLFESAPNAYKIPGDVPGVCEIILADSDGRQPKAVVPIELSWYMRQYTGKINLAFGRNGHKDHEFDSQEDGILYRLIRDNTNDTESFAQAVRMAECNYVVLAISDPKNNTVDQFGMVSMAIIGHYAIYRVE